MNINREFEFKQMNKGKTFKPCNTCCILSCGIFGDARLQCHCGNFENTECKKCKNKNQSF